MFCNTFDEFQALETQILRDFEQPTKPDVTNTFLVSDSPRHRRLTKLPALVDSMYIYIISLLL